MNALAERRSDLAGLVSNANNTFKALGAQQQALAGAVGLLPPVMRRANATFVSLRNALDDVDPLVEASKPAAHRLGPSLNRPAPSPPTRRRPSATSGSRSGAPVTPTTSSS